MPHPDLIKVGRVGGRRSDSTGTWTLFKGTTKTCMEGETSTRPMAEIFAPFAKSLVTRLACIEDEGSKCFHIVVALHNK